MSFLPLLRRPIALTIGLSSSAVAISILTQPPLRCDSYLTTPFGADMRAQRSSSSTTSSAFPAGRMKSKTRNDGGTMARTVQQIAKGSIAGLMCGIAISTFSKPLTLLIGLLVTGISFIESRGIHIIPYHRIQHYVGSLDALSLLEQDLALKGSFGLTFALAAFAHF